MEMDDLVRELTTDLKPIGILRPVPFAVSTGAVCLGFTGAYAFFIIRVRPDLLTKITEPLFALNLLAGLWTIFFGLGLAAQLGLPGRPRNWWLVPMAVAPLLLILFFTFLSSLSGGLQLWMDGSDLVGKACSIGTLVVAALAFPLFGWQLRKGASQSPPLTGVIAGLVTFGAGLLAIASHCEIDNAVHALLYHLAIPLAVVNLAGLTIGRRLFRW